ncbi:S8 family serine peptidase [Coraliomargarita parva]|uniref:S8 family serine peptidase n=1 Tax=Coraliomargarita parva TaxID=3014050 RepID=UPI0022B42D5D|nr:S8 family serine peptidase [Coraliomargarita parva]
MFASKRPCLPAFCLGISVTLQAAFGIELNASNPPYAEGEVIIRFKDGISVTEASNILITKDLELSRHLNQPRAQDNSALPVCALVRDSNRSTAELIEALGSQENVLYVEPNYIRRPFLSPDDSDFEKLWALQNTGQTVNGTTGTSGADIGFPEAWTLSRYESESIVVGVVDTGVDITHPDLADNIWTNSGEIADNDIDDDGNGYIDDVNGYNFADESNDVSDNDGHGTHVAGTIAAVGNNTTGVIGVCYPAQILPLRIEDDAGNMYTSDLVEALEYAVALKESGVNIVAINASLGGSTASTAESEAIDAMEAAGIILCAAAGNDGEDLETTPCYPASYTQSNILSIAASNQSNGLASFSNYGADSVDLAAPGVNIYSTMPEDQLSTTSTVTIDGTSYSAAEIEYSGQTGTEGVSGTVYDCGLGYEADFPDEVADNIALIERGTLTFSTKVTNAMNAGAVAAIIYNNTNELASPISYWTLNTDADWIPAVAVTQSDGESILDSLPESGCVANYSDSSQAYQYLSGTSMATPHVTGAVALAAWNFPDESMSARIDRILDKVTTVASHSGKSVTGGILNLPDMVNSDGDSLPDWWEQDAFDSLENDDTGDSDGDGLSNLAEFIVGTDATTASQYKGIESSSYSSEGFSLNINSLEGRNYQVLWSESLETDSWEILAEDLSGTGGTIEVQDPDASASSQRFYKLEVELED